MKFMEAMGNRIRQRKYFTPAYNTLSQRRRLAEKTILTLEKVVELNDTKHKDVPTADKNKVWFQNVRSDKDPLFQHSGKQFQNRICRTRTSDTRRGIIHEKATREGKFELVCYIRSLAGRCFTEGGDPVLHWLLKDDHTDSVVKLLDSIRIRNVRELHRLTNDDFTSKVMEIHELDEAEQKALMNFQHAHRVVSEDENEADHGDMILCLRGDACKGITLINDEDATNFSGRTSSRESIANATKKINITLPSIECEGCFTCDHDHGANLTDGNAVHVKTSPECHVVLDLLASAVLVKYCLLHSAKSKVRMITEAEEMKYKSMKSKKSKKSDDGNVVELGMQSVTYHNAAGDPGCHFRVAREDALFLQLTAAVWAGDHFWADEHPTFLRDGEWKVHPKSRAEMLTAMFNDMDKPCVGCQARKIVTPSTFHCNNCKKSFCDACDAREHADSDEDGLEHELAVVEAAIRHQVNHVHFTGTNLDAKDVSGTSDPYVRCAFPDRNLHSRMPLDPTHDRLNRTLV
jgi:hypothetical protein